ncbi:ABC-type proline/glycine betaine transport system permease subunit [Pullulanibacillus pueri]|uniref:DUF1453 family protein n=1 Tax=Pullulanibacillus pueri TaxID=1437324 RepID=A0A8J2ZYG5_9BACL|nr:CcdC protein domain-containing protein [Pullulanibacillus pueri]MBM7683866.1 ABC-type proline/glycine betaine transport system permease subunit [Pullulanibacillus pueri]GGH84605.1 hypothetical protein GCM10007096_28070 [Pullulanibacillus pueri]
MDLHSVFTSILMFGLVIVIISRQLKPRSLNRFRFYIMPIIAFFMAYENLPRPTVPDFQLIECLISVIIGIGFGILQARSTKVYQVNGAWVMQGDWRYLITWVALLAIRIVCMLIFNHFDHSQNKVVEWIIWIEIAVVWGVRSLMLGLRYPQIRGALARQNK